MAEKVTLSTNQKKALVAILAHKTIRAAAMASNLADRTLWRYLEDEPFKQALRKAQEGLYKEITNRLTTGMNQALDELESLMTGANSEGVRRQAVSEWLSLALRLRELTDIETRISDLESRQE